MPKTKKITVGYSLALAVAEPAGAKLDKNFKTSNKKIVTIDRAGVITGMKPGKATVSLKVGKKTHKCVVTVVANKFTRSKPLMIKGQKGVFTSMRQLAYKDGGLYVEVYVYNRTSKKVRGYADYKLQISRGDEVLLIKPVKEAAHVYTKPLTVKGYKKIKLNITAAELPGVDAKAFNLAAGELQAVIIGTDSNGNVAIPVTSKTPGYTKVKAAEMVLVDDVDVG